MKYEGLEFHTLVGQKGYIFCDLTLLCITKSAFRLLAKLNTRRMLECNPNGSMYSNLLLVKLHSTNITNLCMCNNGKRMMIKIKVYFLMNNNDKYFTIHFAL